MFYNLTIDQLVNTGIDLIGPLKEYEGKKYIATAVDYFTKFVEAKAIPNKTGEEVGLFMNYFQGIKRKLAVKNVFVFTYYAKNVYSK